MRGYAGTKTVIHVLKTKSSKNETEKIVENETEENFYNIKEELNPKHRKGTKLIQMINTIKCSQEDINSNNKERLLQAWG